jgi:hypothetical protein
MRSKKSCQLSGTLEPKYFQEIGLSSHYPKQKVGAYEDCSGVFYYKHSHTEGTAQQSEIYL